jgi:uncharacterized ferritin-like protein (DUF455 family)
MGRGHFVGLPLSAEADGFSVRLEDIHAEVLRLFNAALSADRAAPYAIVDEPTDLVLRMAIVCFDHVAAVEAGRNREGPVRFCQEHLQVDFSLPDVPSRPEEMTEHGEDRPSWADLGSTPKGRAQIFHDVLMDIEISAMEVCAANILVFDQMPSVFIIDMARQIWDEARHAEACFRRCMDLGGQTHATYSRKLWSRWTLGEDLIDKLCIEQIIQEGNALDSVAALSRDFRKYGDEISASLFDFITLDEISHAAVGNRWVLNLLENDVVEYGNRIEKMAERIHVCVPGRAPVSSGARIRAGFPAAYVASLAETQRMR